MIERQVNRSMTICIFFRSSFGFRLRDKEIMSGPHLWELNSQKTNSSSTLLLKTSKELSVLFFFSSFFSSTFRKLKSRHLGNFEKFKMNRKLKI